MSDIKISAPTTLDKISTTHSSTAEISRRSKTTRPQISGTSNTSSTQKNGKNIALFLSVMKKFTPKGQEMILKSLKGFRGFFESQGKTTKSLKIWEIDDSVCFGRAIPIENELIDKSKSLKDVIRDVVNELKRTGVQRGRNTALNVRTGVQEGIYIDEFTKTELFSEGSEPVIKYAKDATGKIIGKMEVGHSEKGALVINDIATSDEYKGVGKELIRKVVEQSKRIFLGGNVRLTAWTGYLPEDYLEIAGKKVYDKAAAIKYHNMGFKAVEPELERKIVDTIESGGTGLSNDGVVDYLVGDMMLSDEGIKEFLD